MSEVNRERSWGVALVEAGTAESAGANIFESIALLAGTIFSENEAIRLIKYSLKIVTLRYYVATITATFKLFKFVMVDGSIAIIA